MVVRKSHILKVANWIEGGIFIISCPVYVLSGGVLIYQLITLRLGLEIIILGPTFFISSLIGVLLSLDLKYFGIDKKVKGYVAWPALMALTCIFVLLYNILKNTSENLFIAEFYWEAGIELFLRKNGTYKAVNTNWISGHVSYGEYEIHDNNIIITDLTFGGTNILDTLKFDSSKVYFKLEKEFETINEGEMWVKENRLFKK